MPSFIGKRVSFPYRARFGPSQVVTALVLAELPTVWIRVRFEDTGLEETCSYGKGIPAGANVEVLS